MGALELGDGSALIILLTLTPSQVHSNAGSAGAVSRLIMMSGGLSQSWAKIVTNRRKDQPRGIGNEADAVTGSSAPLVPRQFRLHREREIDSGQATPNVPGLPLRRL